MERSARSSGHRVLTGLMVTNSVMLNPPAPLWGCHQVCVVEGHGQCTAPAESTSLDSRAALHFVTCPPAAPTPSRQLWAPGFAAGTPLVLSRSCSCLCQTVDAMFACCRHCVAN